MDVTEYIYSVLQFSFKELYTYRYSVLLQDITDLNFQLQQLQHEIAP